MAAKYSAGSIAGMSPQQLRKEKAYLGAMSTIINFELSYFGEASREYCALGNTRLAAINLRRYQRYLAMLRGADKALELIDGELCKRGALQ